MSDLDDMLSGEPEAAENVQPEAQEAQEAAAEAPEETPAEDAQPVEGEAKPEPMVPLSVLTTTREDLKGQLDAMKAQFAQAMAQPRQDAPPVPDVFEDPAGYQAYMQQQTQSMIANARADMSQMMAEQQHGTDAVQEALAAVEAQPALKQQFMNSPHPYGALLNWHQSQKAAAEIGPDPVAYREKMEAEIRQKIMAEIAAKQAQDMAAQAAPSLANINGGGGNSAPGWAGPTDLSSIIGE